MPHTRRVILFILLLLAAATGSSACNDSNPAEPSPASGATVTGSLVADRAMSGVTVSVSGTNLGAAIGSSQRFTIREVPAGAVRLLFRGAGINGTIDLNGVQPSETIRAGRASQRIHGQTRVRAAAPRRR